jgi:predicted nucleic acid-binding protein
MSSLKKPVILDNDVVSRLFTAGVLRRALGVWPKSTFYITEHVEHEAGQWRDKGQELVALIESLKADGIITSVAIDESSEEEIWLYAQFQLQKHLGQGESASFAIANNRGFDVATDDEIAKATCKEMCPQVSTFGTGNLLNMAVQDKLMSRSEANSIQATIRRGRKL